MFTQYYHTYAHPKSTLKDPKRKGKTKKGVMKKKEKCPVGYLPESKWQMQDNVICNKIKGYKGPVAMVQTMTMPVTRLDDYVLKEGSKALEEKESKYPWVVTGVYAYTEMEPNQNTATMA